MLFRSSAVAVSVSLLVAALVMPVVSSRADAATAAAPGCTDARFHAVAPVRVYDSAAPGGARVGQAPAAVDLSGVVPADACAVVATVTGSAASSNTYVTMYPDGSSRPLASNLKLQAGVDSADLVTVAVGSSRAVDVYVNAGTARMIVDVAGWYSSADASASDVYVPLSPTRVLDTGYGIGTSAPSVGPGGSLTLTPSQLHVPANADAVTVNLTAVGANFLNETGQTQPPAQNVQVIDGAVDYLTRAGATTVGLYSNAGSWTQLVGDQAAFTGLPEWYAEAGLTPAQLVASCTTPFAGAAVALVQDGSSDPTVLDTDLRC